MIWTQKTVLAAQLAFEAHKDQVDKLGVPYVFHLMEVAEQQKTEGATIVALLHDYAEDIHPEWTEIEFQANMKKHGFSPKVISALWLLKHNKGEPYEAYLRRIVSSKNGFATQVKLADLASNSNASRLSMLPEDVQERLKKKYTNASMIFLLN